MPPRLLLLAPPPELRDNATETIAAALQTRGAKLEEPDGAAMGANRHDGLLVMGGLGIRAFFAPEPDSAWTVAPSLADPIRAFQRAGKAIGAPCMALPVVLETLSESVEAGAANRWSAHGEAVAFPDLGLVSTTRPLLGRADEDLHSVVEAFVVTFLGAVSTAAVSRDAVTT